MCSGALYILVPSTPWCGCMNGIMHHCIHTWGFRTSLWIQVWHWSWHGIGKGLEHMGHWWTVIFWVLGLSGLEVIVIPNFIARIVWLFIWAPCCSLYIVGRSRIADYGCFWLSLKSRGQFHPRLYNLNAPSMGACRPPLRASMVWCLIWALY